MPAKLHRALPDSNLRLEAYNIEFTAAPEQLYCFFLKHIMFIYKNFYIWTPFTFLDSSRILYRVYKWLLIIYYCY